MLDLGVAKEKRMFTLGTVYEARSEIQNMDTTGYGHCETTNS